jgi:serine protease Do
VSKPAYGHTSSDVSFRNGFNHVVESAINSVVNISATWKEKHQIPKGITPLDAMLHNMFAQQSPSEKRVSLGSGFVMSVPNKNNTPTNVVVTNYHIVSNVHKKKGRIRVLLNSGQSLDATLLGRDELLDIAVLAIDPKHNLAPLSWEKNDTLKVGHWALAIGNPFGLGSTFTAGVVSHTQRVIKNGPPHVQQWIQTDTPINQGSSGGPLLNFDGRVIGVNTAYITSSNGRGVSIALAIPTSIVRPAVEQLVRFGFVQRGFVGIACGMSVKGNTARSLGMQHDGTGVVVDDVQEGGAAHKGGIKRGDIITKINGHPIKNARQMQAMISATKPGDALDVTLVRFAKGTKKPQSERCHITVEQAPHKPSTNTATPKQPVPLLKSIELQQVPSLAISGLEDFKGPFLVINRALSLKTPLRPGDIILGINGMRVHTVDHVAQALRDARKANMHKAMFLIARSMSGFGNDAYIKKHVLIKVTESKKSEKPKSRNAHL